MENNGSSIFREKSIGRISSPEDLNDYVRVASPGVWLILGAVVILLVGFICWGILGRLETTVDAVAVGDGTQSTLYVKETDLTKISTGMKVTLEDGTEYTVTEIGRESLDADGVLSDYACHLISLESGEWIRPLKLSGTVPEGSWSAKITIESIRPISFILN